MEQLQLKSVSGDDLGVWIAVCGADLSDSSRWSFLPAGGNAGDEPLIRIGASPMAPQFFCSVAESISSLRFIENVTALAKPCITVFALIGGRTIRRIRTVLRHCRRIFRTSRQGLFRKERRLRL